MPAEKCYLAVDLGASSGRVMAGLLDKEALTLEEVHRFPNGPVTTDGAYKWEVDRLFAEVKAGIAKACTVYGKAVVSLGVDTWGVDYGLVDGRGNLLDEPFAYRDSRTDGMMDEAFARVPKEEIYAATGIQFMFFNSLFQVLSEVVADRVELKKAKRLLFTPDLFNYWLSGRMVNERTIASTSQMMDPRTGDWTFAMLEEMGIPTDMLGKIVEPGAVLGHLRPELRRELGTGPVKVVAVGTHDTASAVAAAPAAIADYVFLSSGTWSLMGIELERPIITDRGYSYGFSNEGGVCGTIRLLKNISGLWLIQECRRIWAEQGEDLSFAEIAGLAGEAGPFAAMIDIDSPEFATPGDMPERIRAFCDRSGQAPPESKGSMARTILESLALRYRSVFEMLEELTGKRLETLHIVGGGTQNKLLNQFAANAVNRPVIAGPVEATCAGNILMQMLAAGDIASLVEGRGIIRRSFKTETYQPEDTEAWKKAYARYAGTE